MPSNGRSNGCGCQNAFLGALLSQALIGRGYDGGRALPGLVDGGIVVANIVLVNVASCRTMDRALVLTLQE